MATDINLTWAIEIDSASLGARIEALLLNRMVESLLLICARKPGVLHGFPAELIKQVSEEVTERPTDQTSGSGNQECSASEGTAGSTAHGRKETMVSIPSTMIRRLIGHTTKVIPTPSTRECGVCTSAMRTFI